MPLYGFYTLLTHLRTAIRHRKGLSVEFSGSRLKPPTWYPPVPNLRML